MNKQKEISFDDVSRELDSGIAGADKLRADQLEQLGMARQAKDAGLKREQARLTKKFGADHPRVAEIAGRLKINVGMQRDLRLESTRARTEVPKVDANSWVLHGYVRDKDLKGVPSLTLALYDEKGQWIRSLGYACTDKSGYFKLLYSPAKPEPTGVGAAGEASQPTLGKNVYLHVVSAQGAHLYADKQPLTPQLGRVDYREIVLSQDAAVCRPPESGPAPQPARVEGQEKTRYLGNSDERELHDLENVKKSCQINEIRPDHQVYFKTEKEAQAAGYDYCAYCFGKGKSKR